jgi:putative two-component system response regulator
MNSQDIAKIIDEKPADIDGPEAVLSTLASISRLAARRDGYTGRHIKRTQLYCRLLAQELRGEGNYMRLITDDYIDHIYYAASLHDVGKIGVPESILLKKGRLDPDEFEIMKTHVEIGKHALCRVLAKYPQNQFLKLSIGLTASHHEKWDGSGYPEGLYGQDIPLSARIMALADVYDALRSKRPYKDPLSHEQSAHIIKEGGGVRFDPSVVKAFSKLESKFEDIFEAAADEPKPEK